MSPSIQSVQSQWLAQLASMRAAIAELKLNQVDSNAQSYGQDLLLDDDDLTGGSGSDDIWDILSEETDDEYSSDQLNGKEEAHTNGDFDGLEYDLGWLRSKTVAFASRRSGLDAHELQEQIVALLASDSRGTVYCFLCQRDTNASDRR